MKRAPSFALALALAALLPACSSDDPSAQGGSEGACVNLEGKTFRSLDELECGLSPDGVAKCKWSITFKAKSATESSFDWSKSDYGEYGPCHCEANTVTGTSEGFKMTYTGTYDEASGGLTWDGVKYAPE